MEEGVDVASRVHLAGFREIDGSAMIIIKKSIIKHANRIADLAGKFEELHVTLKEVHEREKSEKYEVHARFLGNGKLKAAEITDRNLFTAVDGVLEKLINEID